MNKAAAAAVPPADPAPATDGSAAIAHRTRARARAAAAAATPAASVTGTVNAAPAPPAGLMLPPSQPPARRSARSATNRPIQPPQHPYHLRQRPGTASAAAASTARPAAATGTAAARTPVVAQQHLQPQAGGVKAPATAHRDEHSVDEAMVVDEPAPPPAAEVASSDASSSLSLPGSDPGAMDEDPATAAASMRPVPATPTPTSSAAVGPAALTTARRASLYKTELCRSWEETGSCRYGTKCQFAHSMNELRMVHRHAKYKTELCHRFYEQGWCPYGRRCCFIHNEPQYAKQLANATAAGQLRSLVLSKASSADGTPAAASAPVSGPPTPASTPRPAGLLAAGPSPLALAGSPVASLGPAATTNNNGVPGLLTPTLSPYMGHAAPPRLDPSQQQHLSQMGPGPSPLTRLASNSSSLTAATHELTPSSDSDDVDMADHVRLDSSLKHELGLDDMDDLPTPLAKRSRAGTLSTPSRPSFGMMGGGETTPETTPESNTSSSSGLGTAPPPAGWWGPSVTPPHVDAASGGGGQFAPFAGLAHHQAAASASASASSFQAAAAASPFHAQSSPASAGGSASWLPWDSGISARGAPDALTSPPFPLAGMYGAGGPADGAAMHTPAQPPRPAAAQAFGFPHSAGPGPAPANGFGGGSGGPASAPPVFRHHPYHDDPHQQQQQQQQYGLGSPAPAFHGYKGGPPPHFQQQQHPAFFDRTSAGVGAFAPPGPFGQQQQQQFGGPVPPHVHLYQHGFVPPSAAPYGGHDPAAMAVDATTRRRLF
ncbi:hypothetical protein H9P43_004570 [Blastocladiella emersonii ATCC 22665]|nr:hypothetical protein H9P43_004570 [Blastocladiella emersonii ATCC 22665]